MGVSDVSIGRVLALNVTVSQPFGLIASNALVGVVTSVTGGETAVGDEVYSVAGVPVRAIEGTVPFYRELSEGLKGEDVRQLQSALRVLGYLGSDPDGAFGAPTARAVRAWQEASELPKTGVVQLGELVAVPSLPTQLRPGQDIVRGAQLVGGEPAVLAHSGDPRFSLLVSPEQAALIPAGTSVDIQLDDTVTWKAVVGGANTDENGSVSLALTDASGGSVCGSDCGLLAPEEIVTLRSTVHVVPNVSGPGVPVAAMRTDVLGAPTVELANGTQVAVTILASGDGVAIVDGLELGDQVVVVGRADELSATP